MHGGKPRAVQYPHYTQSTTGEITIPSTKHCRSFLWPKRSAAPPPSDKKMPTVNLEMPILKPAPTKAGATKPFQDVAAPPNTLPDQPRLKIFNHQNNGALI